MMISHGKQRTGFALPMTIIAIAGLTLLLVGLLTVITLERKTARSYSDAARAELAVESGLATALGLLTEVAGRDDSLVFRIDDPAQPTVSSSDRPLGFREQFFTYGAVFQNGAWRGIPLFSGAPETAIGAGQIDAQTLSAALPAYVADAVQLGRITEYDQSIPRAKWVDVPSPDPDGYDFRYAYWIEDISGRIAGKSAGTLARAEGASIAELSYATIFDPEAANPALPPKLIAARTALRTTASLRQLFTGSATPETPDEGKRIEPYIHFYNTAPAPKIIPQGFGYADAGELAPDLNELVTDRDVDAIADHITLQLPLFENRKGGFPAGEAYVKTLAASFIDYADTDSDTTSGLGYRGMDSYPFVNELFDRYEWVPGPSGQIGILAETYVELWNPTQLEVSGNMEFTNVNKHTIKIPLVGETQFSEVQFPSQAVTIPPNGFLVIPIGARTYTFPEGAFPPSEIDFIDPTKNDDNASTENNYLLKWNGNLVDTARGGLQRTDGLLRSGFSNRKWKGNGSPAHDWSIGQSGDPRASWHIGSKVFANSYDSNSNWGGRALKRSIGATQPYREVRLEKWGDRGSNSEPGVASGTDARVPTSSRIVLKSTGAAIGGKEFPTNQPDMAPAFISNAGTYTSLGELGHIFDPAQWSNVESTSGSASNRAGGGFTLAIGRPEFTPFDTDGLRAAQLLDIFSLPSALPSAAPININTAPREVLRSLIAGVTLNDDPMAPGVEPKQLLSVGDIFADYVIAQRNASPLRAISDLNNIRKQPLTTRNPANPAHTPFFGNIDLFDDAPVVTDPAVDQIEWDDAGREELFRKVMNLVNYSSKTFRIVVAGEARNKQGKLMGRSTREYHYTIEPERDATGLVIPGGNIRLTKHYENSL
jgi:hypothetical protein